MSTALITSRDPKGLQAVRMFEAAYDKSGLDDARAQRLNENGDELKKGLKELIERLSATNQFAREEVRSSYTYPSEYKGLKPIGVQVDILAGIFGLSLGYTSDYIEKVLPTLELPNGADGWFAIPSIDAVAKRFFTDVTDPDERYSRAVNLVIEKIAASRKLYNWREGKLDAKRLRQHVRTVQMLEAIAEKQQGDILIIPAQFGIRHRGRSVRRAREVFVANEFGLGAFAVGCMILTHPERLVRWEQLHMDCAGDEFAPGADGVFGRAPIFDFSGDGVEFSTRHVSLAYGCYGSVSGFLPQ